MKAMGLFWSSVELTGNQTVDSMGCADRGFWSSVELTGNQTDVYASMLKPWFWSSVELTGNQTQGASCTRAISFGAVSN